MKRFFKKVWNVIRTIGLMILGVLFMITYFFKWLWQRLVIWVRDTKWVRKTGKVIVRIFEILYMPIYYAVYLVSIVLRFLTCICYVFMFNPGRAWRAFKLILK
jgi:hypothetical protein